MITVVDDGGGSVSVAVAIVAGGVVVRGSA